MGNCHHHGLDYKELVPIQEAAGYLGERQIYNPERVVGCLGEKSALSNSSESWRGVSFYTTPHPQNCSKCLIVNKCMCVFSHSVMSGSLRAVDC